MPIVEGDPQSEYDIREVQEIRQIIETDPVPVTKLEETFPEASFGFDLGRKTGAVDIIVAGHRYLIYPSTQRDQNDRKLLASLKIPHFPAVEDVKSQVLNYAICPVPLAAQALDSQSGIFREQFPVVDYIGAFEILGKTAEILKKLHKKSHKLPELLNLNKLAITTGSPEFIRLIPPYSLIDVTSKTASTLTNTLIADLLAQDPVNNHDKQIEYFLLKFKGGSK